MSYESPIYIPNTYTTDGACAAEIEAAIRILSPNGISPTFKDSFSQTEFNALEKGVLEEIIIFCHENFPHSRTELLNQAKMYIKICNQFAKTNIHMPDPVVKQEEPVASGSGYGSGHGSGSRNSVNHQGSPVYYGSQSTNIAPFNSSSS